MRTALSLVAALDLAALPLRRNDLAKDLSATPISQISTAPDADDAHGVMAAVHRTGGVSVVRGAASAAGSRFNSALATVLSDASPSPEFWSALKTARAKASR